MPNIIEFLIKICRLTSLAYQKNQKETRAQYNAAYFPFFWIVCSIHLDHVTLTENENFLNYSGWWCVERFARASVIRLLTSRYVRYVPAQRPISLLNVPAQRSLSLPLVTTIVLFYMRRRKQFIEWMRPTFHQRRKERIIRRYIGGHVVKKHPRLGLRWLNSSTRKIILSIIGLAKIESNNSSVLSVA